MAALEVIIYAGAIMVLFVFVVMMLNLGPRAVEAEQRVADAGHWIGPALLAASPVGEKSCTLATRRHGAPGRGVMVDPKQVGMALFGPYLLGVELASMLLLAGLVGAYHLGRRRPCRRPEIQTWHQIPMEHGLILAGILFSLGLVGVLVRRNMIFMLMSLEIMLNAAGLAFVVAGSRWEQADGQVMFMFILAMAAAEVSVGLALCCSSITSSRPWMSTRLSEMRG